MKFNIVLGNHPAHGINTTRDHTLIIRGGLEEAGHNARLSFDQVTNDEINIFYDYFDAQSSAYFHTLRDSGIQYGLICTEILENMRINARAAGARIAALREIGQNAEFVWVMHEPSLANYRELIGHEKCLYLPLGYSEAIRELRMRPWRERHIDFVFFGLLTPHRIRILTTLKQRGHTVVHTYNTPGFIRNSIVENSRINLVLKQHDKWPQPSVGRICYLVSNCAVAMAERTSLGDPYENYLHTADSSNYVQSCENLIGMDDAPMRAEEFRSNFRNERPMREIMSGLIDNTFSES